MHNAWHVVNLCEGFLLGLTYYSHSANSSYSFGEFFLFIRRILITCVRASFSALRARAASPTATSSCDRVSSRAYTYIRVYTHIIIVIMDGIAGALPRG